MSKENLPLFDVQSQMLKKKEPAFSENPDSRFSGNNNHAGGFFWRFLLIIIIAGAGLYGIWKFNQHSVKATEERALKNLAAIENELFQDLMEVKNPDSVPLNGLARNSSRAQSLQKEAVDKYKIPVEVENVFAGIRFRLIPAGSFVMGSPRNEPGRDSDEVQHEVAITEPFYCSKYEITQRQWRKVMGTRKSCFTDAERSAPVECVSWKDAQNFLDSLCRKSGVTNITYRLLTEAQWEYACRAGTYSPIYTGGMNIRGFNNAPELNQIGWYAGNSGVDYEESFCDSSRWPEKQFSHSKAGTHPAGGKIPNAFGLYDMIGNVWEWCLDWYDEYPESYTENPQGPERGHYKVIRGGAMNSPAHKCRSADRDRGLPDFEDSCLGFRIMREIRFEPYPSNVKTNSTSVQ